MDTTPSNGPTHDEDTGNLIDRLAGELWDASARLREFEGKWTPTQRRDVRELFIEHQRLQAECTAAFNRLEDTKIRLYQPTYRRR